MPDLNICYKLHKQVLPSSVCKRKQTTFILRNNLSCYKVTHTKIRNWDTPILSCELLNKYKNLILRSLLKQRHFFLPISFKGSIFRSSTGCPAIVKLPLNSKVYFQQSNDHTAEKMEIQNLHFQKKKIINLKKLTNCKYGILRGLISF